MGTFTDKLALLITANSTQAVSELRKVGVAAETNLSKAEFAGSGFQKSLVGIGAVAPAVGAGLLALGAISVKTAIDGEAAHTRLQVAITNVGQSTDQWSGKIQNASDRMAKLGFDNIDVETSLARLVPATKNVGEAIRLQGIAADIARGRNISLADATNFVVAAEKGRYRALLQSGILSKNQVAGFHDQNDALNALAKTYGGSASAFSHTLAGNFATLTAESKNLAQQIGNDLAPVVSVAVQGLTGLLDLASKGGGALRDLASHLPDPTLGAFTHGKGSGPAVVQLNDLTDAQKNYADAVATANLLDDHSAETTANLARLKAQLATAQNDAAAVTNALSGAMNDNAAATDSVTNADQQLSAAQAQLKNDLSAGDTKALVGDREDLTAATIRAAQVAQQFAAETSEADIAAGIAVGSVISLADAYQILGQSEQQAAASSFGNLSNAAFSQFDSASKAASGLEGFQQSLADLTKTEGAAGGAAKNATAEFFNQQQKVQSLRAASQALGDTQVALQRAQYDETQATKDAAKAAQDYQDVLHGVRADSAKGIEAKQTVGAKKDARATAALDVNDAIRNLAETQKKYGRNSEEAQRAAIELRDKHRTLTAATIDLQRSQKDLNGTLHGYAIGSPEWITAAGNLRTAQDHVTDATKAVRDATDGAHDAQVNLQRSTADLQGKLNSLSTGGAQKQVGDFATKLDNVKQSAKTFAEDVGANVAQATGSVGKGLEAEIGVLKSIVDTNPLLKGAFDNVLTALGAENARFQEQTAATHFKTLTPVPAGGRVPRAAEGGILSGPKSGYLAILHGTEAVVPLGKKLSGLPHGVARGGSVVNLNVAINNPANGDIAADQLVRSLSTGRNRTELKRLLGVA